VEKYPKSWFAFNKVAATQGAMTRAVLLRDLRSATGAAVVRARILSVRSLIIIP
jgi:hypothetical protein